MKAKFQPQGKIIVTGEDGVPWELYENGYLLFRPTKKKNTLTNPTNNNSWKEQYGDKIIAIGFTGKVFAPKDSSWLFSLCNPKQKELLTQLQYIEVEKIDTAFVENMYHLFYQSKGLTYLDIQNWDTSNVRNMEWVFCEASGLQTLNLNNWNTSKVTTMYGMFNGCSDLIHLYVNNWDTSNVRSMSTMFWKVGLTTLDVSNWDTSNVMRMKGMFWDAKNLKTLSIDNWDTSNVVDMSFMFYGTTSLTFLNIINWNISNVLDMSYMFAYSNIQKLNLNKLTNKKPWGAIDEYETDRIYIKNIFQECSSLTEIIFPNVELFYCPNLFYGCIKLTTINFSESQFKINKIVNLFPKNNCVKLVDCTKMRHSFEEINNMFNELINDNILCMNADCIVLLPN